MGIAMRLEKLRYKKEQSDYDWNFLMVRSNKRKSKNTK